MRGLLAAVQRPGGPLGRPAGRLRRRGSAAYDALPAATSDPDRFPALQAIEALVTHLARCRLPPRCGHAAGQPDTLHASCLARRDAFAALPGTAVRLPR